MDISYIIGAIIVGLIAGFVARALVPGKDSMGIIPTIILGLVGSFLGSILFLAVGIGDSDKFDLGGIIGAIVGAIIALVVFNMVTGRKKGGHATPVTRT